MHNKLTDGLADVISYPLTVQVINHGLGIPGSVVTGLITPVAAILAVLFTYRYTLRREGSRRNTS